MLSFDVVGYKTIYQNYPFIVLEQSGAEKPIFDKELLGNWDKKTIESNQWF